MKSILATLLTLSALPVAAQDVSAMRLLPGWETEEGTRMIGVEILLDPGWKTYWRAPGPGGIPPLFDWAGSENVAAATIHWPRPQIQHAFGLTNLGYKDSVVFPVEITPADPAVPTEITLALSYGVCEDVCIPAHSTDSLSADRKSYASATRSIEAALATSPLSAEAAGISSLTCTLDPSTEPPQVTAAFSFNAPPMADPFPVFETGSEITFLRPLSTATKGNTLTVLTKLDHYGKSEPELDFETLRITLLDAYSAIEITGCPTG